MRTSNGTTNTLTNTVHRHCFFQVLFPNFYLCTALISHPEAECNTTAGDLNPQHSHP